MRKYLHVVFLMTLLAFSTASASAQRNGNRGRWELLGQARVDGAVDHDNISVDNRNTYRAIQIRVQNAPIRFNRVIVHFGNGADETVNMRNLIQAGGQTRAIDLPGNRREIRSVELWYARGGWGTRKPTLTLYGRQ